jgi:hypothetical protein
VVVKFTPKKTGFLRNLEKIFMEIRRRIDRLEIKFAVFAVESVSRFQWLVGSEDRFGGWILI